MKSVTAITLIAIMLFATTVAVSAVDSMEIRGNVQKVEAGKTVSWDPQTFAGFYYDLDDDIGNEKIDMKITGDKVLEPELVYTTTTEKDTFDYDKWGQFDVIGFLGEKYFAGYFDDPTIADDEKKYLAYKSEEDNLLAEDQLSKILYDDDTSRTMTTNAPLQLKEGYELVINAIDLDGNKVYVDLMKNGEHVNDAVVEPSKEGATMKDETYVYKKDLGETEKVVVVAVHFKNAFRGAEQDLATVDGIFQISDEPMSVKVDDKFDKMEVTDVTATTIELKNSNDITLSKNKDFTLMSFIKVKTADQDVVDAANPLRFYIYKEAVEPGTYEVRGTVQKVEAGKTVSWDPQTFAGFYYDLDDDIGNEKIDMKITVDKVLEPELVYTTTTEKDTFDFDKWGQFDVIGFLGEKYFAGYFDDPTIADDEAKYLAYKSEEDNLLAEDQLSMILYDDDTSRTMTTNAPLQLKDGYELVINAIDLDGNKVYVDLMKNSEHVNDAVVEPSKEGATMKDQTYVYKKDLGETEKVVVVAVHFKNAFRGAEQDLATVDGIFQISDEPISVKVDDKFDKMEVTDVTATTIEMKNSNDITLSKNKDFTLMSFIKVKTADQDLVDAANPLRFYIYKEATIEGEEAEVAPEVIEEVAPPAEEVTPPAEEVTPPAEEEVAPPAEEGAPPVEEEKKEEKGPGFEAVFAVTGLLAVAYLVLRRKE